ncbi:hypothetical protein PIB30_004923 [Stylosanthes scabra]|uniref:ethanolamine kinase n=1 Tax=Stylosanthes scabra TaxID=79078 RepID=A0ABU6W7A2_9FABA|nr:hypothetical protein [Stylosanthes scabra]
MEVAEQEACQGYASQDILSSPLTIDPSLPLPHIKHHVVDLCKDMFKEWSNLDDSCFLVERISGGITNLLLKVSVKEENRVDVSIAIRLFGLNTDNIIDRQRELQAIKYISAAGFGAKWLGVFGNGMVQSFINAYTLTPSDMREPKQAAKIAKQLQRFHQLEIPGSKEPQLWNEIIKFFEQASVLGFDDIKKQKTYETISFAEVHDEIVELKELTERLNSPVVYAHNDLLSGNVMINNEQDKVYLIDYEYASYNYRGYDIGNHFAEYAGFDCDYTFYPNRNEQYHFFRHYLQPERPNEVSREDLEALYVEANAYALASHIFWALWALIQAKVSPIDFDYLGYFFLRYKEYKRQKDKYLLLARSYLAECNTNNGYIDSVTQLP